MAEVEESLFGKQKRRRRANFDAKQEEVLVTAARLFCENGFERTSMTEIANAIQITKPTLYYYFKNKDKLLLQIKRRAQGQIIAALDVVELEGGTGLAKLRRLMGHYIRIMSEDCGKCLVTVRRHNLDPDSRQLVEDRVIEAERRIIGLFKEGMADGSMVAANHMHAYHTVFGSLNWIAVWYRPTGPMSVDELIENHIRLVFKGLEAPSNINSAKASKNKRTQSAKKKTPSRINKG